MNPLFDEKARQLDTDTLEAFGIRLQTRYAKANEMRQMLAFAESAARKNLHTAVALVFYDSNADLCTFEFNHELSEEEDQALFTIARQTITQGLWNDTVFHRFGIEVP